MRSSVALEPLFNPRAITVIGASSKADSVGRTIFENLLRSQRPVYPVHPLEDSILGSPVCKTVDDLPSGIDLAVIATNAERT